VQETENAGTCGRGGRGSARLLGRGEGETRPQRDWVYKTANVLDRLPKSVQPAAKRAIFEITNAENKDTATRAVTVFASEFGPKWPKAIAKITDDQDSLLTFYDFPAEYWKHLRTTNPIESTFAPVRARTNPTKGPGSREAGLAMVFKLIEAAGGRWRKINGHELVALVRAGAKFVSCKLVEAQDDKKDAA
jgi:putative transposase